MARICLYPCLLLLGLAAWLFFILDAYSLSLFSEYWASALTMLFGSFVAGSTPLGGGAVAFPVFTKLLGVETEQAKVFGLFIQSVGMSFATILFVSLKIKIHWRWLCYLFPSSVAGLLVGLLFLQLPSEQIRLLLSVFVIGSGILLLQTQFKREQSEGVQPVPRRIWLLLGFPAGVLSALVGTGADALLFFCVVLLFRRPIKDAIPTSVAYMAMCSLMGSVIVLISGRIEIADFTFNSWLVAAPVVSLGAPLGGFVMSKINPRYLLLFIKAIILTEGVSTLMFVNLAYLEKLLLFSLILAAVIYLLRQWRLVLGLGSS